MTHAMNAPTAPHRERSLDWAAYALGFALGGFFDGILLHQILQWHHLLSGIEQARHDIATLILADGLFHLLMYVIAVVGLWLLWRGRAAFAGPGADVRLLANALIGFGLWHIVDGVLSHWILGIHRIRMDVDNPLLWDILWLAVFGIIPLIAGWLLRGRASSRGQRLLSSPLAVVAAVTIAGSAAAVPAPQDDGLVMVMFRPGVSAGDALAALQAIDARLVWNDAAEKVWAVSVAEDADPGELYGFGALIVSNSILPAGCFDWIRA